MPYKKHVNNMRMLNDITNRTYVFACLCKLQNKYEKINQGTILPFAVLMSCV